jgi:hypothetical protein
MAERTADTRTHDQVAKAAEDDDAKNDPRIVEILAMLEEGAPDDGYRERNKADEQHDIQETAELEP